MPLSRSIELRNSTISGVSDEDSIIIVNLDPAVVHESDGRPGIDTGATFLQAVRLRIAEPGPRLVLDNLPSAIASGTLTIGGQDHHNLIALPMVYGGPTELRCLTAAGETLHIRGKGIALVFSGERKYIAGAPRAVT